ncbi:MAG: hypothetical protein L6246_00965 [Thermodesulfovibrionales bacterium]|nr:hypothetical protein [Thermodesulfovibrionales bacterium]
MSGFILQIVKRLVCHSRSSGILLKERFWTSQNDINKDNPLPHRIDMAPRLGY